MGGSWSGGGRVHTHTNPLTLPPNHTQTHTQPHTYNPTHTHTHRHIPKHTQTRTHPDPMTQSHTTTHRHTNTYRHNHRNTHYLLGVRKSGGRAAFCSTLRLSPAHYLIDPQESFKKLWPFYFLWLNKVKLKVWQWKMSFHKNQWNHLFPRWHVKNWAKLFFTLTYLFEESKRMCKDPVYDPVEN